MVQCVKVRFGRIDPTTITVLHLQIGFFICKFRTVNCRIDPNLTLRPKSEREESMNRHLEGRSAFNVINCARDNFLFGGVLVPGGIEISWTAC